MRKLKTRRPRTHQREFTRDQVPIAKLIKLLTGPVGRVAGGWRAPSLKRSGPWSDGQAQATWAGHYRIPGSEI